MNNMIIPINKNVVIRAEEEKSPYQSREKKYVEKGIVVSIANDCPKDVEFKVGDLVGFKSYLAERYESKDKQEYWVAPFDKLYAIERDE